MFLKLLSQKSAFQNFHSFSKFLFQKMHFQNCSLENIFKIATSKITFSKLPSQTNTFSKLLP